jgi:hypothetical protein
MNSDTGAFKEFAGDDDIKPPWTEWSVDELIEIKGGLFQVVNIDVANDSVTLRGRNKQARKPLEALASQLKGIQDDVEKAFDAKVPVSNT